MEKMIKDVSAVKGRLSTLDAMRGIAALAVLLDHMGLLTSFQQFAEHGAIAVDLFFMISGFVMARAYEPKFVGGLWRFGVQRMARLYPMIMLAIIITIVSAIMFPAAVRTTDIAGWVLYVAILPDLRSSGHIFPLNPVLWSLFLEIVANLCHCWLFPRTRLLIPIVGLSAAAFAGAAIHYGGAGVGAHTATFWAGFALVAWGYGVGVLLCRFARSYGARLPHVPAGVIMLLTIGMLFGPAMSSKLRTAVPLFVGFPMSVLLGAYARSPARFVRRVTDWLGDISYPLYAIHWPLLLFAIGTIGRVAALSTWVLIMVVILGASTLAEYWWDAPVRRWLKHRIVQSKEEIKKTL